MAPLNPEQFTPGVFGNRQGEPDPDLYNRPDDWKADHSRWARAKARNGRYVDHDLAAMKRSAKENDEVATAPLKEKHEKRQASKRQVTEGMAQISKGLRMMRGSKRRRW